MRGGYKNIEPRYKKGESGNPKGRPKKTFTALFTEYNGTELLTSADLNTLVRLVLSLDMVELRKLAADEKQSIAARALARKAIESGKEGMRTLDALLDRAFGKVKEPVLQIAGTDKDGNATPLVVQIIRESIPKTDD